MAPPALKSNVGFGNQIDIRRIGRTAGSHLGAIPTQAERIGAAQVNSLPPPVTLPGIHIVVGVRNEGRIIQAGQSPIPVVDPLRVNGIHSHPIRSLLSKIIANYSHQRIVVQFQSAAVQIQSPNPRCKDLARVPKANLGMAIVTVGVRCRYEDVICGHVGIPIAGTNLHTPSHRGAANENITIIITKLTGGNIVIKDILH